MNRKIDARLTFTWSSAVLLLAACNGADTDSSPELELLEPTPLTEAEQAADPALAVDPETGELRLAWVAETDGEWNLYFARSADGGSTFSAASRVNDVPGDLHPHAEGAPRLVAAPGVDALFWNNRVEAEARTWSGSDMRFARSTDDGATWSAARTLQDPLEFATLPPRGNTFHGAGWAGDSTLVVAWIDGRERDRRSVQLGVDAGLTPEEAARTPEAFVDNDEVHDDDSVIYAAISHDLGESWEASNTRIQDRICPCCRVSLARTPDGQLLGSWRMHFDGSVRDPVTQTVVAANGTTANSPTRIHEDGWVYPGCPHSGPGLDVDPAGTVHAAWYTGADGRMGVHYARKSASANAFEDPVAVVSGDAVPVAHPTVAGLTDGSAVVAHNVDANGDRVIVLTGIDAHGHVRFQREVPGSERATHPQIVRLRDDRLVIAWTESHDGHQRVRLARLTLDGDVP